MTGRWNNITLLVVEDVTSSIMYYKSAFKYTGAKVLIATDGKQALEIVENNPNIDIIIMDIVMPKMDGLEATHKIKEINPNIKVIIQTAYVLTHTEYQCYNAGCDAFLKKPVSLKELFELIDNFIEKK